MSDQQEVYLSVDVEASKLNLHRRRLRMRLLLKS
jgi:hypothetical protein